MSSASATCCVMACQAQVTPPPADESDPLAPGEPLVPAETRQPAVPGGHEAELDPPPFGLTSARAETDVATPTVRLAIRPMRMRLCMLIPTPPVHWPDATTPRCRRGSRCLSPTRAEFRPPGSGQACPLTC